MRCDCHFYLKKFIYFHSTSKSWFQIEQEKLFLMFPMAQSKKLQLNT